MQRPNEKQVEICVINLLGWLFHNLNFGSIAYERPKPLISVNDMVAWDPENKKSAECDKNKK